MHTHAARGHTLHVAKFCCYGHLALLGLLVTCSLRTSDGHNQPPAASCVESTDKSLLRIKDAVDAAGYSVAGGHDLNGDSDFTDIVVGAFTADDGAYTTGAAYVIFGQGE